MREGIPPLRQYVLVAWCLVEHRDNFTSYFYRQISISVCGNWKSGVLGAFESRIDCRFAKHKMTVLLKTFFQCVHFMKCL